MASPRLIAVIGAFCFCLMQSAGAQLLTSPADFNDVGVTANGMRLAENRSAIDRARLYRDSTPPQSVGVDANGNALPTESTASEDDSFGAQQILKSQERLKSWIVTGGVSLVYTNNVALTRTNPIGDGFVVVDAGIGYASRLGKNVEANASLRIGLFRYFETSELDFQSLGFGLGVTWTPASMPGVGMFARYDFTQLLSSDMDQILMDHIISLGVQKAFIFGRSHGLNIGAFGTAGFSDPNGAQRSQLGAFLSYRLQVSRKLESEVLLRPAAHFYTDSGRFEFNQIISLSLLYRLTGHADLRAFFSYGFNRSDRLTFDYNALTTGAGAALGIRF